MTSEVLLVTIIALLAGAAMGWLAHGVRTDPAARRSAEEVIRLRGQLEAAQARSADFGRHQAIETLVAPLRSTLDKVQQQLREVERTRAGSQASLVEQINTMRLSSDGLRLETSHLVTALRAPQVRGRWGEMQLERVVEAAGLQEHIDYVTQASVSTDDGTVRPDLVVRLVGGKNVVVDSKVALAAYLDAMQSRDEATRNERFKAHARQLRAHVDALAGKEYWRRFSPSPEFVVCFVPADAFLDAAMRVDHQLLEHAFSHDVVLATPSTLVALLRTIAYTWRQDVLAANAAEVHQLGRELYTRLSTMGAHVDKLGRSLGAAVDSYNQAVGSLESRVMVSARRLNDLKVTAPGDELAAPTPLTITTRRPQAEEFSQPRLVPLGRPAAAGPLAPATADHLNLGLDREADG